MVEWHTKSNRLPSGGKRRTKRRCTKKKAWVGGSAAHTKSQEGQTDQRSVKSGRGNTEKVRATAVQFANVYQDGKIVKAEIIEVDANKSNRLFARSNTVTKGAEIKVKVGTTEKIAKVTNRPGQEGIINAIIA